jgi:FixJ family two-component response regulator
MEIEPILIIIDDDLAVREGLDSLLRAAGQAVVTYSSASEFLTSEYITVPSRPVCILLDIRMPGLSGFDLQAELIARNHKLPIVFLTGHGDIPMAVAAMKKDAISFLTKPVRENELLEAVRTGCEVGRRWWLETQILKTKQQDYQTLTAREREVMEEVVAGHPNKQIAASLGITEITVKVHRGQVMRKMKVNSLAELVRAATLLSASKDDNLLN